METPALRVLLDTSDLINVIEHSRPIPADELEECLRSRGASLVLTFTNVLEFVAPLLRSGDFLRFRPLLQRLERMPVLFLSNSHAPMQELKRASEAFQLGVEYTSVDPYVCRWEETAQFPGESICRILVGLRIDEAVHMIWKSNPEAIAGNAKHIDLLIAAVAADRQRLASSRWRAIDHFPDVVRRYLQRAARYGFAFPEEQIAALARWIYKDPRRCPGLRLHYEIYHQKLGDLRDVPQRGDISDHSLASCLPYVEVISVDKRTANYLSAVCRRLERGHRTLAYSKRVYTGLDAILRNFVEPAG